MKSKTSCFNAAILRSDITRFAPVWILYTVALVLLWPMGISDCRSSYDAACKLNNMTRFMVGVNGIYAMIVVQALFGDLLIPRMCYALHAMPLTRDSFFRSHSFAGILFSLVPNILVTALLLPVAGQAGKAALWLLICSFMEYLFFFGTAELSIQLSGNRIGMILVYGLINFIMVLVGWFVHNVYLPLIPGVILSDEAILSLCPTYAMLRTGCLDIVVEDLTQYPYVLKDIQPTSQLHVPALCAMLGLAATAAAQILYRRRRLECAGDLLALKCLHLPFLILYTLMVAGFCHVLSEVLYLRIGYVFLLIGTVVGFYTGLMLLKRQVNVFSPSTVLPVTAIVGVLALTLVLTAMDFLNISGYIPYTSDITQATVRDYYEDSKRTFSDEENIEIIRQLHAGAIKRDKPTALQRLTGNYESDNGFSVYTTVEYTLKNGKTVSRTYYIPAPSEESEILKNYYATPEALFQMSTEELEKLPSMVRYIEIYSQSLHRIPYSAGLMEAICQDSSMHNNASNVTFHVDADQNISCEYTGEITFVFKEEFKKADGLNSVTISVRSCNVNTVAWLDSHSLMY